jgi:hypothetical protein
LDGYHKGHTVTVPEPLHKLSLAKPKTITLDTCCYEGDEVMGVDRDLRKDYQLAGYSVDRSIAFYSTNGSMESLFNRDWICHQDGYQWKEQPIYVGMHDPRAVVDYSTIDEPTPQPQRKD